MSARATNCRTGALVVWLALASVFGCAGERQRDTSDGEPERTGLICGHTYLGGAQSGVRVILANNDDFAEHFDETESDEEGYFEIEVVPGTYALVATYTAWDLWGSPECADYRINIEVGANEGVGQDIHLTCEDID